jgi:MbtH protein
MEEEDTREYVVLVNIEEQYSLWLADLEIPKGWREVFARNNKKACLEYVKEVWTDMRPLSLRKAMAEANSQPAAETSAEKPATPAAETPVSAEQSASCSDTG